MIFCFIELLSLCANMWLKRGKNGGVFRMAVFGYTHCLHSSPYNIQRITGCLANYSSSCTKSQRNQVTAIRALAKSNGYVKDWEVMPANEPAKKRFTLVLELQQCCGSDQAKLNAYSYTHTMHENILQNV
uniref:Uncharacterized protein n=1 Tax=Glossina pallidipes TaxID=7398 RepID=A0A1B0A8R8_GLOPL